ncbi:MAG TPA: hypothetical protein VGE69_07885 [Pseudomonadales bacterium]
MLHAASRTPSFDHKPRSRRPSRYLSPLAFCLALVVPLHAGAAPWMASGGSGHTQLLDGDGRVWAFGYNKYGAIGDGSTVDAEPHAQSTPRQAVLGDIVSIASGQGHSLAVKSDGSVWSWGYGYLGHDAYDGRLVPTQVAGLANIRQLASGRFHTLALKQDGTMIGWGNNSRGAVGDGTNVHRPSPVALALTNVRAIAANGHSLALKNDGTVWAWGENNAGQTGGIVNENRSTPAQVPGLGDVIAIAAGFSHSVALKSDGTVWSWGEGVAIGDGNFNQTTTPVRATGLDRVTAIAAGSGFTLALRDDGTVWTFGITEYTGTNSYTASSIPQKVAGLANVRAIGAGWSHRVAVLADGSVHTWGLNDVGQLGNGQSGTRANTPVRVIAANGTSFALNAEAALKTDVDRLFNWAESVYPHLFMPHTSSSVRLGYYARCYATGLCLGERDGRAYLYNGSIRDVGGVTDMLNLHAIPAGF